MTNDPVWWTLVLINLAVVFLLMLNGFLRGSWKEYIDVVLGGLILCLLIVVFIMFGWLACLGHLVGSLIFGAVVQPTAARLAHRIVHR